MVSGIGSYFIFTTQVTTKKFVDNTKIYKHFTMCPISEYCWML